MRNKLAAAATICAASLVASACSDRSAPSPTAPAATTPRTIVTTVVPFNALACDFTALKADARDYAASNKDVLFTIIGDLQGLVKTGPTAPGTDKVFDGLARLAVMRGSASLQKSTATGAMFDRLTRRFLGCAEAYVIAGAPPQDFTGAVGPNWMYEVRGKPNVDSEAGAYERGATGAYWAAEAGGATWGATLVVGAPAGTTATDRALVFGYRTTFFTNDPKSGSAFEHFTIPAIGNGGYLTVSPGLKIGLCNVDVNSTLRVQHISTVLPLQPLACTAPATFAAAGTSSSLMLASSFVKKAVSFFAPTTAYAFAAGSVGGAVSELSPSAVIDMQQVILAYKFSIVDGRNTVPLQGTDGGPVKVVVSTKGGTTLPNVMVTLAVAGNNSVIAYFSDNGAAPTAMVQRTTDANGVATFDGVTLTKAGGYQLVATGTFDGVAGQPKISNSFNIQNK